jgi:hypothetical protein
MWKEDNVPSFNLYMLYLCLPGKEEQQQNAKNNAEM